MTNISLIQQELAEAIQEIEKSQNNIEINRVIERLIISITNSERASIWIYDDKNTLIRERDHNFVREISMERKVGLLYECFAAKKAGIYNYLASEKGYVASVDNPDNIKMKSKIMIPLIDGNKFVGIATAYSSVKQIKKFKKDDLEILKAIAPSIINAIYRMKSNFTYPTIDRRKNRRDSTSTEFHRRKTDTINNLKVIEESRTDTKTPKELLDYVANIVHDIRTPSNSLFGFLEILEEKVNDPRLKQYILHAKDSANLINELTTSILDDVSSKREASLSKSEKISTFKFFADIAEVFSATMHKKQIKYNIFIDPKLPKEITIESVKLKRVIMNLIGNAHKFTKTDETIEFSVRYKAKDKKIHIFVKDSGIGIAKEKQEQIFEAFKQAEDNTKEQYGGTGLGLAISAGYVKELGGKLLIDSEIDRGSIFYFDIPIEINDDTQKFKTIDNKNINIALLMSPENSFVANHIAKYLVKMGINIDKIDAITNINDISKETTHMIVFENKLFDSIYSYISKQNIKMLIVEENFLSLNPSELHGATLISQYGYFAKTLYSFIDVKRDPKVLIVDDDKISVALIKTMLMDELCQISVAYNGAGGLELLSEALQSNEPYNIVYLDSNMPIFSGEEVLRKYRALEREYTLNPIKAVSISGDQYAEELKDFDLFVGKPFDKNLILSAYHDTIK